MMMPLTICRWDSDWRGLRGLEGRVRVDPGEPVSSVSPSRSIWLIPKVRLGLPPRCDEIRRARRGLVLPSAAACSASARKVASSSGKRLLDGVAEALERPEHAADLVEERPHLGRVGVDEIGEAVGVAGGDHLLGGVEGFVGRGGGVDGLLPAARGEGEDRYEEDETREGLGSDGSTCRGRHDGHGSGSVLGSFDFDLRRVSESVCSRFQACLMVLRLDWAGYGREWRSS